MQQRCTQSAICPGGPNRLIFWLEHIEPKELDVYSFARHDGRWAPQADRLSWRDTVARSSSRRESARPNVRLRARRRLAIGRWPGASEPLSPAATRCCCCCCCRCRCRAAAAAAAVAVAAAAAAAAAADVLSPSPPQIHGRSSQRRPPSPTHPPWHPPSHPSSLFPYSPFLPSTPIATGAGAAAASQPGLDGPGRAAPGPPGRPGFSALIATSSPLHCQAASPPAPPAAGPRRRPWPVQSLVRGGAGPGRQAARAGAAPRN